MNNNDYRLVVVVIVIVVVAVVVVVVVVVLVPPYLLLLILFFQPNNFEQVLLWFAVRDWCSLEVTLSVPVTMPRAPHAMITQAPSDACGVYCRPNAFRSS